MNKKDELKTRIGDLPQRKLTPEEMKKVKGAVRGGFIRFAPNPIDTKKKQTMKNGDIVSDPTDDNSDKPGYVGF